MRRLFKKITCGAFDPPNTTAAADDQTPQEQQSSSPSHDPCRNIPSPTGSILGDVQEERSSDDVESRAAAERFPQFLTTMDAAGRPRYVMEKVRSEGRLVIFMAESRERRRRVVRTAPSADITEATTTRLVIPKD